MKQPEEHWRRRFEAFAAQSDEDHVLAGWTAGGLAAQQAVFVEALHRLAHGSWRFLDLGCGPGAYTRLLAAEGHTVVGADFVPPVLRKAADKTLRAALPARFMAADAYHLPFRDGAFDAAALLGVLQILGDEAAVTSELVRVLRPGGRLFLITRNALYARNQRERRQGVLRSFNPHLLARRLRRRGFNEVEIRPIPLFRGEAHLLRRLHSRPPTTSLARLAALLSAQSFLLTAVRGDGATARGRLLSTERLYIVRRDLQSGPAERPGQAALDLRAVPASACGTMADWKVTRRDLYRSWERSGARCFVGFVDSAPAVRIWAAPGGPLTTRVIPWLRGAGAEVTYFFDVETLPAFRGRGLFELFAAELLARLQTEGARAAYARIEVHNSASLRAFTKLGFVADALITEYTLTGRRVFWRRHAAPGTTSTSGHAAS